MFRIWKTLLIFLGFLCAILISLELFTFKGDFLPDKKAEDLKRINLSKYKKNEKWILIPPVSTMTNMGWYNLSTIYHQYLNHVQYKCTDRVRMGKITDGGWDVCSDKPYRPTKDGLVYSFGINFDFSFDDAISKKYRVPVYSFDPSMKTKAHRRSDLVHFVPIGIAEKEMVLKEGWKLSPLSSILKDQGHKKEDLQVLKMDIEGWEWKVLPELIQSHSISHIKQLFVEFHLFEGCSLNHPEPCIQKFNLGLNILRDLYELGFRIFWTHDNTACLYKSIFTGETLTSCKEIYFVKVS